MRIVSVFIRQRQHDQVGRFAGCQATGFVGPAQRFGAAQRGHAQDLVTWNIGITRMDEARFGQQVQIGIGCEAVGAKGDADASGEELTKRMRRMAEGSVGARTVDDGGLMRDAYR